MGSAVKDLLITPSHIWVTVKDNIVKMPNQANILKKDITCTCEGNVFKESYCKHKSMAVKYMKVKLSG
jgi:hypothetical protein